MISDPAGHWLAEPTSESALTYAWRLTDVCAAAPTVSEGCAGGPTACAAAPGRVVTAFIIERRLLTSPTPAFWEFVEMACVDVTALNPPPSPVEVFSYFQRLPLPELTAMHQPPGNGLSGLPVIFYTDMPTTAAFTVDIRGFAVVITAGARSFTWHTGDPTEPTITTDDPGAPYPDHTVTHDYRSGTYTASLTVTWGATFTVAGSSPTDVPGTTTTTGPPDTFDVLQARPVLVSPQ